MKKWKIEVEEEEKFIYVQFSDDEDYQMIFYPNKDEARKDILEWINSHINN